MNNPQANQPFTSPRPFIRTNERPLLQLNNEKNAL